MKNMKDGSDLFPRPATFDPSCFKELRDISPKKVLTEKKMLLSSIFSPIINICPIRAHASLFEGLLP